MLLSSTNTEYINPCWMNNKIDINKFQIYDATTVLCMEVSYVERDTDCLLI